MFTHFSLPFKLIVIVLSFIVDFWILKGWKWIPQITPRLLRMTKEQERAYRLKMHLIVWAVLVVGFLCI